MIEQALVPAGHWRSLLTHLSFEDPEQLLANPYNWRLHEGHQRAAMTAALSEIGWAGAVLVNDTTGHVIDGHMRVEVALGADEPGVPVLHLEATEEQEQLILATYDPIGALAVADRAVLASLLTVTRPEAEALRLLLQDQAVRYREGRVSDAFKAFLENEIETSTGDVDTEATGPWLEDDEDEEGEMEDDEDETEGMSLGVFAVPVTPDQRGIILDALREATSVFGATTRAEALTSICLHYLDSG